MNISPTLGVWLLSDDYDGHGDAKTISASAFSQPVKALLLSRRVTDKTPVSVDSLVASKVGTAIHEAIERSWLDPEKVYAALEKLELPARRYIVNPQGKVPEGMIPVYLEQRVSRKHKGWTVTGKYDMVFDGRVHDYKSTKAFVIQKQLNNKKWRLQGSIYRWLNPEVITDESLLVEAIVLDWNSGAASSDPAYPQSAWTPVSIPLLSLEQTEDYISNKLELLDDLSDAPEADMPRCTDEELWRDEPTFAYYASGVVAGRSTKNFKSRVEADAHLVSKGKGVIQERPGPARACSYCPAAPICQQRLEYLND